MKFLSVCLALVGAVGLVSGEAMAEAKADASAEASASPYYRRRYYRPRRTFYRRPSTSASGDVTRYLTSRCGMRSHSGLARAAGYVARDCARYRSTSPANNPRRYVRTAGCEAKCAYTTSISGLGNVCSYSLGGAARNGNYTCAFVCFRKGGYRPRPNRPMPRPPRPTPGSGGFNGICTSLTNAIRRASGLSPLRPDYTAERMSRQQAECMRSRGTMSHQACGDFTIRLRQNGLRNVAAAENIAAGRQTAQACVTAWRNSPGHLRNMLKQSVSKMGCSNSGGYCCQVFTS